MAVQEHDISEVAPKSLDDCNPWEQPEYRSFSAPVKLNKNGNVGVS